MSDPVAIAEQFTQFYYQQFDSDRSGLASLYRENSMLTWESTQIRGVNDIVAKLVGLPFQTVQHKVVTIDAQPSNPEVASIIVLVTGQLLVDDGQNALQFTQIFHLIPEGGSYYVFNDVFRL
ncbi:hypothetical protein IAT38_001259 [Cryptococcus sp. DSM 104549]